MLNGIMLNGIMLNVVMLNGIMLNVVMPSVILLNVMALLRIKFIMKFIQLVQKNYLLKVALNKSKMLDHKLDMLF